jgi:hypothetical protein
MCYLGNFFLHFCGNKESVYLSSTRSWLFCTLHCVLLPLLNRNTVSPSYCELLRYSSSWQETGGGVSPPYFNILKKLDFFTQKKPGSYFPPVMWVEYIEKGGGFEFLKSSSACLGSQACWGRLQLFSSLTFCIYEVQT